MNGVITLPSGAALEFPLPEQVTIASGMRAVDLAAARHIQRTITSFINVRKRAIGLHKSVNPEAWQRILNIEYAVTTLCGKGLQETLQAVLNKKDALMFCAPKPPSAHYHWTVKIITILDFATQFTPQYELKETTGDLRRPKLRKTPRTQKFSGPF